MSIAGQVFFKSMFGFIEVLLPVLSYKKFRTIHHEMKPLFLKLISEKETKFTIKYRK